MNNNLIYRAYFGLKLFTSVMLPLDVSAPNLEKEVLDLNKMDEERFEKIVNYAVSSEYILTKKDNFSLSEDYLQSYVHYFKD